MNYKEAFYSAISSPIRSMVIAVITFSVTLCYSVVAVADNQDLSSVNDWKPLLSDEGELLANIQAVKDIKPFYPRPALKDRQQGYVLLSYSVTRDGKVDDVKVVEEYPQKTFASSALRALKASEFVAYNPKGKKSRVEGLLRRYEFVLAMNDNLSQRHPWE